MKDHAVGQPVNCVDVPVFGTRPITSRAAQLGESPLWDPRVGIRWLDVEGRQLLTICLDGQETSIGLSGRVTCIELAPDGLLAVTTVGFGWLDPERGVVHGVVKVVGDGEVSMNDGGIDARGRCWAGSTADDGSFRGRLYRLGGDEVSIHVHGIGMSNGIDWSPEGDVLYHVDSTAGTITAYRYRLDTGQLGAGRLLRSVPAEVGLPDGLTVDAEGQVWVALWGHGQVWRIHPQTGDITAVVEVPTPYCTSCAFGGPDLCTLFVTTANYRHPEGGGLLYATDLPVRGRPPNRFAGMLP